MKLGGSVDERSTISESLGEGGSELPEKMTGVGLDGRKRSIDITAGPRGGEVSVARPRGGIELTAGTKGSSSTEAELGSNEVGLKVAFCASAGLV